jgi:hypothetical protein
MRKRYSTKSCICPDWLTCSARSWCSHSKLHRYDYGCSLHAYHHSDDDTIHWCNTQCEDRDTCARRKTHHCMRSRDGKKKRTESDRV